MILATTVHRNGNSTMVRIPPSFAEYFGLRHGIKCRIQDISSHEIKIILD